MSLVEQELKKICRDYKIHPYSIESERLREFGEDVRKATIKGIVERIDNRVKVLEKAKPPLGFEEYTPEVYELRLFAKVLLEGGKK